MPDSGAMTRRAIEHALEASARRVARLDAGGWRFDLGNGTPLPMTAQWEADWLRVASVRPVLEPGAVSQALALNGAVRGPARIDMSPISEFELVADIPVADIPLDGPTALPAHLVAACESVDAIWAELVTKGARRIQPASNHSPEPVPLEAIPTGLAWEFTTGADGRTRVGLDTALPQGEATLTRGPTHATLRVEFGGSPVSDAACRATATFLLALTGGHRLVRATATPSGPFRLEVDLPGPLSATDLELGCSALSLAFRLAAKEVRALSDPGLAARYLEHFSKE